MSLKNKIFARLNLLESIVSPPPLLNEVLAMIDRDDSSAKKMAEIILKDPNLTAKILRVANSSFYGCRQKVSTINQAIMILGLNAVKCLVLSMSIYNQVSLQHANDDEDFVKLWQHFLETASAAQNIASGVKYPLPEEAYIAGLLHDFGLLFLQRFFAAESSNVKKLVNEGMTIIEAERNIFETDHQDIGAFIASKWNLPKLLAESIGNHHPKDIAAIGKLPMLSRITILADNLSPSNLDFPGSLDAAGTKLSIIESCCTSIGIGMAEIKKIYSVLPKQVLYHAEGISLDLGDAILYLSRVNSELFDLYIQLANTFRERQELSERLLKEERLEGTLESLHIALATLSHYINNSTSNISGQAEVLKLLHDRGNIEQAFERIPVMVDSVKSAVKKISIVLNELSSLTSLEKINYFRNSKAIDIEKSLKERLDSQTVTR